MKKFILRSVLFCLLPLPLLFAVGYIVDSGLKKSRYYYYSEWNDLFTGKINADMLILGSSRAWVQISPRILDSVLHLNSYNLGMDASCFSLQYERFKIYLKHNRKPKYIIQEVGYISTLVNFKELPGSQQFLPYLNDPTVWEIVRSHNETFRFTDRYFPLYKYNNEFVVLKEGILSYLGRGAKDIKYKGYQGQDKAWDSSFYYFKQSNPEGSAWPVDPKAVAIFKEYLDFCKANGIQVIMVYPPSFIEGLPYVTNKEEILAIYNKFSKEYGVPFYNYMYDSLNYNRYNFYNSQHLNRQAAEVFTTKFATQIRQDMHVGQ